MAAKKSSTASLYECIWRCSAPLMSHHHYKVTLFRHTLVCDVLHCKGPNQWQCPSLAMPLFSYLSNNSVLPIRQ